jgi:serine-type D-Ala-D-Ala carboxypeptidase/endopeptidase
MGRPEVLAGACVDGARRALGEYPVMIAAAAIDGGVTAIASSAGCLADARFEIGSLTKTFTATLLASLVGEGVVKLDDDVDPWIPAAKGRGITLRKLATHTSGLPRLARNNLWRALLNPRNPYARYTAERAERGLQHTSQAKGAAEHAYSNFGYQLLGLALERASGQPYHMLLQDRILTPLSLTCSGTGDSGGGTRIPGHSKGKAQPHWVQPLPGAGGMEATAQDIARYLKACLDPPDDALGAALTLAQAPELRIDEHRQISLAWIIRDQGALWHTGQTGGFTTSAVFDPTTGRALVVLVNTAVGQSQALDRLVLNGLHDGT